MTTTVEVHDWLFTDGTSFGCGTAVELAYWQAEGIVDPSAKLGAFIAHEPASEDARRKAMWGLAEWHDKVPA